LQALGARVATTLHSTNRVYVCRHYRLLDPKQAPPRAGTGADYDYFGYAAFYAEQGHFALSLSCPTEEAAFADHMKRPSGFERICGELPAFSEWVQRSTPTTKVLGAGNFANRFTRYGARGGKRLAGFFAVGDSHIETNPMYGRGCASAFVQAKVLGEVLREPGDPVAHAERYSTRVRSAMQPHFDFCVGADRMMESRGKLSRGEPIALVDRLIKHAYERAFVPAMQESSLVAREMVRAMQMRELSSVATRLRVLWQLVLLWLSWCFGRAKQASLPAALPRLDLLRHNAAPAAPSTASSGASTGASTGAARAELRERAESGAPAREPGAEVSARVG
jgi:hypothetical protein